MEEKRHTDVIIVSIDVEAAHHELGLVVVVNVILDVEPILLAIDVPSMDSGIDSASFFI